MYKTKSGIKHIRTGISEADLENNLYLRLAIKIAGQYAKATGSDGLDYVGEALLSIVVNLNRIKNGEIKLIEDSNVTGYLVSKIHTRLSNFIKRDRRYRNKIIERFYLESFLDESDLIAHIAPTELHKEIIHLRYHGYTSAEIANQLGISRTTVTKYKNEMRRTYESVK